MNDNWQIKGLETLENPVVYIFDRYGKLLKQLGVSNAWNGRFDGVLMPATDYWFKLEYASKSSGLIVAEGRRTHFSLKI